MSTRSFSFSKVFIFWLTSPSPQSPFVRASSLPFGQDIVCVLLPFLSTSHESSGIIILLYMSFSLSPPTPPTPHLATPPNSHTTSPRHRYIHLPYNPHESSSYLLSLSCSVSWAEPLLPRPLPPRFVSPHLLTLLPPRPLDRGFVSTSVCLYVLGAYV
jgi:hypothetical protein